MTSCVCFPIAFSRNKLLPRLNSDLYEQIGVYFRMSSFKICSPFSKRTSSEFSASVTISLVPNWPFTYGHSLWLAPPGYVSNSGFFKVLCWVPFSIFYLGLPLIFLFFWINTLLWVTRMLMMSRPWSMVFLLINLPSVNLLSLFPPISSAGCPQIASL